MLSAPFSILNSDLIRPILEPRGDEEMKISRRSDFLSMIQAYNVNGRDKKKGERMLPINGVDQSGEKRS